MGVAKMTTLYQILKNSNLVTERGTVKLSARRMSIMAAAAISQPKTTVQTLLFLALLFAHISSKGTASLLNTILLLYIQNTF